MSERALQKKAMISNQVLNAFKEFKERILIQFQQIIVSNIDSCSEGEYVSRLKFCLIITRKTIELILKKASQRQHYCYCFKTGALTLNGCAAVDMDYTFFGSRLLSITFDILSGKMPVMMDQTQDSSDEQATRNALDVMLNRMKKIELAVLCKEELHMIAGGIADQSGISVQYAQDTIQKMLNESQLLKQINTEFQLSLSALKFYEQTRGNQSIAQFIEEIVPCFTNEKEY